MILNTRADRPPCTIRHWRVLWHSTEYPGSYPFLTLLSFGKGLWVAIIFTGMSGKHIPYPQNARINNRRLCATCTVFLLAFSCAGSNLNTSSLYSRQVFLHLTRWRLIIHWQNIPTPFQPLESLMYLLNENLRFYLLLLEVDRSWYDHWHVSLTSRCLANPKICRRACFIKGTSYKGVWFSTLFNGSLSVSNILNHLKNIFHRDILTHVYAKALQFLLSIVLATWNIISCSENS